jgi:hypothetical protein
MSLSRAMQQMDWINCYSISLVRVSCRNHSERSVRQHEQSDRVRAFNCTITLQAVINAILRGRALLSGHSVHSIHSYFTYANIFRVAAI